MEAHQPLLWEAWGAIKTLVDEDTLRTRIKAEDAEFLGKGTFGETWRVRLNGADYALKCLYPNMRPDRAEREIMALQKVSNPFVVKYYSQGLLLDKSGNEVRYILCEYVPGGDLWHHLKTEHYPSQQEVLAFAKGLLQGLRALHKASVVHRDISLTNIVLRNGRYENPVLIDLGMARLLDMAPITTYPGRLGTPHFMAPEVLRFEPATFASDLWSAGTVLYLLCTGSHPYLNQLQDTDAVLDAVAQGRLTPRRVPDNIQPKLAKAINTMLSYNPQDRGSARRLLAELEGD